jgi:hypothetical protein
MRMTHIAILLATLLPSPALAQYKNPDPPPPTPKQVEPSGPHPSLIPGVSASLIEYDVPREVMSDALKDLDGGDYKDAGKKLKAVIEATQSAADTCHGEAIKANLLRSAVELESKVERLKSGGAVERDEMTAMFSRDLQALSEHHAALAQVHFQAADNMAAGQDLRASVLNANQAFVWGNVKPTVDDTNRLSLAGRTAKTLIEQKMVDKVGTQKLIVDLQNWVNDLKARLPKAGA